MTSIVLEIECEALSTTIETQLTCTNLKCDKESVLLEARLAGTKYDNAREGLHTSRTMSARQPCLFLLSAALSTF